MTRILFLCLLAAIPVASCGEDDEAMSAWTESKGQLCRSVKAYLAAFSAPAEKRKWDKRLDERVTESNRTVADIALDWFSDCEKKLEDKDPKKIKEAAFWFLRFVADDVPPPLQMRSRMTKQNFDSIIEWLDAEVEKAKKPDAATVKK